MQNMKIKPDVCRYIPFFKAPLNEYTLFCWYTVLYFFLQHKEFGTLKRIPDYFTNIKSCLLNLKSVAEDGSKHYGFVIAHFNCLSPLLLFFLQSGFVDVTLAGDF